MMDKFSYEQIAQAVNSLHEINQSLKKISKEKDNDMLCIWGDSTTYNGINVYMNKNDCIFCTEYFQGNKRVAVSNKYTGERIGIISTDIFHMVFPQFPKED